MGGDRDRLLPFGCLPWASSDGCKSQRLLYFLAVYDIVTEQKCPKDCPKKVDEFR